ncbi:MAG: chemotaxis protein CheA [Nitrosomonas sp.]|uniref:chemotaxis protein CheA n=1 Tax=Nitrosomonas sp. TaxID=42353 RepID=UPI00272023D3|nr:chemotaxis protein CheA [Nitrosomonas sp.]MDO8894242.1 chemotaxis protein CheA [Nitrosomonas sp.]MDO9469565.1 chemotaxis protein CheA [Nitrosomonas sp.]MDP1787530.1 chemotaxis protein CheA [Nitrosomonas sp.]MDP2224045.1 chemotaxis protein CheA [Nitrosomonas sp.]
MSTDLEQFYEIFFEESSELLADMETCLLRLDVNSPDLEDLNAIFRAAHSIKGGAGTFGFTDMTEMTHMLESLLDKLRKGELEVRSEMIDAFLKAGDVIKAQLAGHRGEGQADPIVAAAVCEELKRLSDETQAPIKELTNPATNTEIVQVEAKVAEVEVSTIDDSSRLTYRIEFSGSGMSDATLENLFANLKQLGNLESLTPANVIDLCKLKLTTDKSEEDIWETLAFVVDPATLIIVVDSLNKNEAAAIEPDKTNSVSIDAKSIVDEDEFSMTDMPPAPGYGFFPGAPAAPKDIDDAESSLNSPQQLSANNSKNEANATLNKSSSKANTGAAAPVSETSSIRVSIEKVDQMINLVGELVITQAMLAQTASQFDPVVFEKLHSGMNQLERNTRDLQESVMSIRMMPISFVFSRYPRVVRDLASKLNKRVELKTVGENTELDKGLIEKIADPLTHLVRNSLDHGIEVPEKRTAAGKLAQGTITLRAFHQGGSIVIEVSDDGAGLNRGKILSKARERGLPVHDGMTDQEVWLLIFEAGFSTADTVTDVSGRGVGMDVVKRNIQGMGGRIDIESAFGVGTRISIRLPLTLAILDGLSVAVGGQMFIVPLNYIIESLQPTAADIKTVSGHGRVVQVRGEYLPVIALHEIFNLRPNVTEVHEGILVILEAEGHKAALFVDDLVGQHQVVIKSLESNYRRVQGVSGATIMGDGKVALILDTAALVMTSQQEAV